VIVEDLLAGALEALGQEPLVELGTGELRHQRGRRCGHPEQHDCPADLRSPARHQGVDDGADSQQRHEDDRGVQHERVHRQAVDLVEHDASS
jgi:hypothetical protein